MVIKVDEAKLNTIIHKLINIISDLRESDSLRKREEKIIETCEKKLMSLRQDVLLSIEEEDESKTPGNK